MSCAVYHDVIGHVSHAIYNNRFATAWRSVYCLDEYKANSFIATTGWKLVKDDGLFNMITKAILYSIHKFDHQWLNTQTATSLANYFMVVRHSARKSWKTFVVINQNAFYPKIFYSRIHFLLIQLKSKVLGQSGVHNKSKTPRSRVTK